MCILLFPSIRIITISWGHSSKSQPSWLGIGLGNSVSQLADLIPRGKMNSLLHRGESRWLDYIAANPVCIAEIMANISDTYKISVKKWKGESLELYLLSLSRRRPILYQNPLSLSPWTICPVQFFFKACTIWKCFFLKTTCTRGGVHLGSTKGQLLGLQLSCLIIIFLFYFFLFWKSLFWNNRTLKIFDNYFH